MIEPLITIYPQGIQTIDPNTTVEILKNVVSGQQETFLLSWNRLKEFAFWYGAICIVIGAGVWEITRRAGQYLSLQVRKAKKEQNGGKL